MTVSLFEIAAALLVGVASWNLACLFARYMRLRVEELQSASDLLDDYEDRVDSVLFDPALPDAIRNLLGKFDDSIGHPLMAKAMVRRMFTRRQIGVPKVDVDQSLNEDLEFLTKYRADLSRDFVDLIAAGFGYTMMKWPFSARVFRLMLVDIKRDAITPARTLIEGVKHNDFGPGGGVAAPA